MPNTPHAIVAFLATASLGAMWSICSPDMGPVAVLDRFAQIEPVWLFAVDGQTWGGRHVAGLPGLKRLALVTDLDPSARAADFAREGLAPHDWAALVEGEASFEPEWLPFEHPLWIVYSSGTTGPPKPIVHGHGGIVLESLKGALHNDVHPTLETGERFFWSSSTDWIFWNAALLGGTTLCVPPASE